jgi:hypothetical protein
MTIQQIDPRGRIQEINGKFAPPCRHTSKRIYCEERDCAGCEIQNMSERVGALEDYWKNVAGGNEPC